MSRLLRVTMEIEVEDLSPADRLDCAAGLCFDEEAPEDVAAELPLVADLSAQEVARVLPGLTQEDLQAELWAGSEVYATFGKATVIAAEWAAPT